MACDFELPPRIKLDHGAVTHSGETSGDSRGTSVGANTGKKGSTANVEPSSLDDAGLDCLRTEMHP